MKLITGVELWANEQTGELNTVRSGTAEPGLGWVNVSGLTDALDEAVRMRMDGTVFPVTVDYLESKFTQMGIVCVSFRPGEKSVKTGKTKYPSDPPKGKATVYTRTGDCNWNPSSGNTLNEAFLLASCEALQDVTVFPLEERPRKRDRAKALI